MNSRPPLNLGVIGGGIDSAVGYAHVLASQMDKCWRIKAACFSRDQKVNLRSAEAWGVGSSSLYSDWKAMFDSEIGSLDAVVVLTPTPLHAEIVIYAIKCGYPVICEKALALTTAEVISIKKVLNKYQGYLAVTYNYTGYPMLRELKHIIMQGQLGKLTQVILEMPQQGFACLGESESKPMPQSWRLTDGAIPTLSLDLGVHVYHLIKFLTEESPIELVSMSNSFGHFSNLTDTTFSLARYTNNLDCQVWFTKAAIGCKNGLRVRIFAEKGAVEWFQGYPEEIQFYDAYGSKRVLERGDVGLNIANAKRFNRFKAGHPSGFIEAFANHYYDLALSIREYYAGHDHASPWVFGIEDALDGMLMLEAMARSSKERKWQSIGDSI